VHFFSSFNFWLIGSFWHKILILFIKVLISEYQINEKKAKKYYFKTLFPNSLTFYQQNNPFLPISLFLFLWYSNNDQ
jgi:hypothetical protein